MTLSTALCRPMSSAWKSSDSPSVSAAAWMPPVSLYRSPRANSSLKRSRMRAVSGRHGAAPRGEHAAALRPLYRAVLVGGYVDPEPELLRARPHAKDVL